MNEGHGNVVSFTRRARFHSECFKINFTNMSQSLLLKGTGQYRQGYFYSSDDNVTENSAYGLP